MANVIAPNLRGKGFSATKLTKSGDPKRTGNWSAATIHYQSLQSKDYPVFVKTYENGIQVLMVGENTPLSYLMGEQIASLAMSDGYFESYRRSGQKSIGAKKYDANMTLRKYKGKSSMWLQNKWGTYREEIYTDGDFKYQFPEY